MNFLWNLLHKNILRKVDESDTHSIKPEMVITYHNRSYLM